MSSKNETRAGVGAARVRASREARVQEPGWKGETGFFESRAKPLHLHGCIRSSVITARLFPLCVSPGAASSNRCSGPFESRTRDFGHA
jgi:hypothetical protein